MNNFYKYSQTVKYSDTDSRYKIRLDRIISHFQDITGLHSGEMGVDGKTLFKKSNAYWVLTKIKLKIIESPKFNDVMDIETWPIAPAGGLRYNRDYVICKDGRRLVLGCSEWCTLDAEDMKLRRVESTCYPINLDHREERSGVGAFSRAREKVSEDDYHHSHTSMFVDIDTNKHTNNITYVRMTLNCFTPEEYESMEIDEFQINYLSQTYCGDTVSVYKKKTDYGYYVEGKLGDKSVFCSLVFVK